MLSLRMSPPSQARRALVLTTLDHTEEALAVLLGVGRYPQAQSLNAWVSGDLHMLALNGVCC